MMKDDLFDSDEKIEDAKSAFASLQQHEGWKLFIAILNRNIKIVKDRILNGSGASETKEEIDRLRDKLMVYREVRDTPNKMLKGWQSDETEAPNPDPYPQVPPRAES